MPCAGGLWSSSTAARSDVRSHAFTDRAQRAFPRTRDRKIPTLAGSAAAFPAHAGDRCPVPGSVLPYEDIAERCCSGVSEVDL